MSDYPTNQERTADYLKKFDREKTIKFSNFELKFSQLFVNLKKTILSSSRLVYILSLFGYHHITYHHYITIYLSQTCSHE